MKDYSDYPRWICSDCAHKVTKKKPCCAHYHDDICDVCNEWKQVTQPRDYGYPDVKRQLNKAKILAELEDVKQLYIKNNEIHESLNIEDRIVPLRLS